MDDIELALWVNWIAGREYQVSILRSPHGLGTHRFVVPEGSSLLTDVEAGPAEDLRDVRRRTYVADRSPLLQLREQGEELFRLVFAGENRDPFRKCLEEATSTGAWLRLRLSFQNAPAAADWPWEALVVDWTGQFLANLPRVSFERTPGLAQSTAPPPLMRNRILRILIICASPAGLATLDIKREKIRIASIFRKAGTRLKVVVATTHADLDKATAVAIPFDIVHVICHGDFEENTGELVLEGERKDGSRLTSRELTALLRRPAALAFLNACHSARGAHDPFAGFAESLLRAGTSAVIGMRRPITEEGAQKVAAEFYQHLAAGETVAHALAKWRETSSRNDADWAVPVLYLAGKDFVLLPAAPPPADLPGPIPEPPPRPRWKWLWVAAIAILVASSLWFWPHEVADPPPTRPPQVPHEPRCEAPQGLDLPMVLVKKGTFMQGSESSVDGDESPVHQVTITQDFCLGAFEITWGLYGAVMGSESVPTPQAWYPVEGPSWQTIQPFAAKLNQLDPAASFRLPTSAEWEYAARAGSAGDEDPDYAQPANCLDIEKGDLYRKAAPVGSFSKNAWGLYDMKGNVWEWVEDWEGPYPQEAVDPRGPAAGKKKVRRGGSYGSKLTNCRVSTRRGVLPDRKQPETGFRIARTPVP